MIYLRIFPIYISRYLITKANKRMMKYLIFLLIAMQYNYAFGKVNSTLINKALIEVNLERKNSLTNTKNNNDSAFDRLSMMSNFVNEERRKDYNNFGIFDFRIPLIWYQESF